MNAKPTRPRPDVRAELARLLPGPVERDLPGDRHRQLQEFVMSQIHQDTRPAEPAPRRPRRVALLAATVAATLAAGLAGAGVLSGSGDDPGVDPDRRAAPPQSARQILVAAAASAERAPQGSGTYWYVKTAPAGTGQGDGNLGWETWTGRDGKIWFRGHKSGGQVVKLAGRTAFVLAGHQVSLAQIQALPTEPGGLKARIAAYARSGDVRTSAGRPDARTREGFVFTGLISLVSQLPAPQKVRAAVFRAIAGYPGVKELGPVGGGFGLLIPDGDKPARMVVDPKTSRVLSTTYYVTAEGAEVGVPDGASITTGWTDRLPQ